MKFVKIVGYFRTGTNYVQWLLENNFYNNVIVLVNHFGFKHGNPNSYFTDYVKDASFNKFGKKTTVRATNSLSDHQKRAVLRAWENNKIGYVICVRSPYSWMRSYIRYKRSGFKGSYIKEWNERTRQHYEFYKEHEDMAILVKHEDLINNSLLVLRKINDKFDLDKKGLYRISSQKTDRGGRLTKAVINKEYYSNGEYLKFFTKPQIRFIDENLDKELYKAIW